VNWVQEQLWIVASCPAHSWSFKIVPADGRFSITFVDFRGKVSDRNLLARVDSEDEAKRFCEWVARAMDLFPVTKGRIEVRS
jgi:hypothetical protein